MYNQVIPYPEVPFRSSHPVSEDAMREAGCFTTIGARLNVADDRADTGSKRAVDDSARTFNRGQSNKPFCTASLAGNMVSLSYPEVLPERIEIVAYTAELGFLHDGITLFLPEVLIELMDQVQDFTETDDVASLSAVHERLASALDPNSTATTDGSMRGLLMKKIFSAVVLECLEIDLQAGLDMMKSYSAEWLRVVDGHGIPHFRTLDEYLEHRIRDSGSRVAIWRIAFGMGIRLSQAEYSMMESLFKAAMRPTVLSNDFYSWSKERGQLRHRTTNAVLFYMNTGLVEEDAIARVKQDILDLEASFLKARDVFCRARPDLPVHLKMMVNSLAPLIGGYHYWACVCPRYNSAESRTNSSSAEDGFENVQVPVDHPSPRRLVERLRQTTPDCSPTPKLDQTSLDTPIRYIQSLSSKNVLPQLVDAFNLWFGLPAASVALVKDIVSDLHNASLILDDIQDSSLLRRGGTAAHVIFGEAQAINSATYMFVRVAKYVHAHGSSSPALMTALLEDLETLFTGQSWELNWRFTGRCPSEEEYMSMVDCKTGALFRMLLRSMLALAGGEDDKTLIENTSFDQLTRLMGRWYQIRDDYMNLQSADYTQKKGFAEDLDEGKCSYPVVQCCADPMRREILTGLLLRRDRARVPRLPDESKRQILGMMNDAGAMEETWWVIMRLQGEIERDIGRLEGVLGEKNPILRVLMKVLGNIPPVDGGPL
ncbi:bifunctional terpene synthase/polyprenyl synthetase family protein [Aspergillus lucknowensis]|uniref:Isoprenoid synthase domain-containing protein n=1 Tax=Aspergillus lucknowensis TaxID=176173 RepID=A0ABR4LCP1_9EURO